MAIVLELDGVDDHISCPIGATSHNDWFVEIDFPIDIARNANTWQYFYSCGSSFLSISSTNKIRFSSFVTVTIDGVPQSYVNDSTLFVGSGLDSLAGKVVKVKLGIAGSPSTLIIGANSSLLDNMEMQLNAVNFYNSSNVLQRNWDADLSVHTAGTPILTNTLGGNNATGVNMPTAALGQPGSAWIDLGGGGISLSVDSGSYSYTGSQVEILVDRLIQANSGTYNYTGANANLLNSRLLKANNGSYSYSGSSISLLKGLTLVVDEGVYSYTGNNVTLTVTAVGAFTLTADTGVYSYTGLDINFNRNRVIIAASGIYTYSGSDIQIILPGQVWTDKASVSTSWGDQANAETNWANQTNVTTTWTDK